MRNCKRGGCLQGSSTVCPTCKDWTPSTGSKYYRCSRYAATRATCDNPHESCGDCPHYEAPSELDEPGRPNISGIDWSDPDEVREYKRDYMRDYMRERRAKEADESVAD